MEGRFQTPAAPIPLQLRQFFTQDDWNLLKRQTRTRVKKLIKSSNVPIDDEVLSFVRRKLSAARQETAQDRNASAAVHASQEKTVEMLSVDVQESSSIQQVAIA